MIKASSCRQLLSAATQRTEFLTQPIVSFGFATNTVRLFLARLVGSENRYTALQLDAMYFSEEDQAVNCNSDLQIASSSSSSDGTQRATVVVDVRVRNQAVQWPLPMRMPSLRLGDIYASNREESMVSGRLEPHLTERRVWSQGDLNFILS
eukprot:scaffold16337_cov76-Cylindrotheca_fusiformis.AAC.4